MVKDKWAADYLMILGCHTRIRILKFLKRKPRFFNEIAEHIGMHRTTVSTHLRMMCAFGFVKREYASRHTEYTLLDYDVFKILKLIPKRRTNDTL